MIIKVTQEHIDKGVPCKARECPVALALKDNKLTYFGKEPMVGIAMIMFNDTNYEQNNVIRHFRSRFDKHLSVEPFEFNTEDLKKWD